LQLIDNSLNYKRVTEHIFSSLQEALRKGTSVYTLLIYVRA